VEGTSAVVHVLKDMGRRDMGSGAFCYDHRDLLLRGRCNPVRGRIRETMGIIIVPQSRAMTATVAMSMQTRKARQSHDRHPKRIEARPAQLKSSICTGFSTPEMVEDALTMKPARPPTRPSTSTPKNPKKTKTNGSRPGLSVTP
jgi:hypothetical protein